MTDLTKVVRRRTGETVRDAGKLRRVVVTLHPGDLIGFRLEGNRTTEYLSVGAGHALALRMRVQAERADKARAKKARASLKGTK